jgi:hypothetical protein
MALLLDQTLPLVPSDYDPLVFGRIVREVEIALTKVEFPAVVSSEDDVQGFSWFMD